MIKEIQKYSEEELVQNYEKFMGKLDKVFSGDRLEKLKFMYSDDELGEELATAPASNKPYYHNAYIGGYLDHITNVFRNAVQIKKIFEAQDGVINFTMEELAFAAIHHDLGKLGDGEKPYYIINDSDWHIINRKEYYTHNPELEFMDVGDRTTYLLQKYGISITKNEFYAIKLADGMYNDHAQKYFKQYNEDHQLRRTLPFIIHWADHMATLAECQNEYIR